jgi:hypothetical protein
MSIERTNCDKVARSAITLKAAVCFCGKKRITNMAMNGTKIIAERRPIRLVLNFRFYLIIKNADHDFVYYAKIEKYI